MYIKCSALYVGQGAANLIEVYENETDSKAKSLILIDYGSAGKEGGPGGGTGDKTDEPDKEPAYTAIAEALYKNQGKLDLLILTHLDEDHINKVPDLVAGGDLKQIDRTIIGGTDRGISATSHPFRKNSRMRKHVSGVVRRLAKSIVDICNDIRIFTGDDGYLDTKDVIYDEGAGRFVLKLLANRSTPGVKGTSEYINSNSSVIVAEYKDCGVHYAMIFPGDATSDTFRFINRRFADPLKRVKYGFLNASKKIVAVPHHGALKTACDSQRIKKNIKLDSQLAEAKKFASALAPTHVYVSAHYRAKHYFHPNKNTLELYLGKVENAPTHNVFCFSLKLDANGCPECTMKVFSPKYDLVTQACDKQLYCAHSIAEQVSIRSASYYGGGSHKITALSGKSHIFGSFVCEIRGSGIQCAYEKVT